MATIAERHDVIAPAPLPTHEAPVADVHPRGARRRVVFYLIAMFGAVMLRDGKELA